MNLKQKYLTDVVPALMKKYGYKSIMQVPRLKKSCLIWQLVKKLQTQKQLKKC